TDGDRGKLSLVVDHERRKPGLDLGHRIERDLGVVGPADIDAVEIGRVALILRIDLEDDAVLVALGVEGRDLPLRVGVLSALAMSCTRTPMRDAATRSIDTLTCSPPCSRSVDTSTSPGTVWILANTRGAHCSSSL